MLKLAAWAVAVVTAYMVFMNLPDKGIADPYIVGIIGLTLLATGFIMLVFTRDWTARALGMMSTALGCAALYLGSLMFYLAPETRQWSEPITTSVRALLVIGGPLWSYGIVRYVQGIIIDADSED